MSSERKEIERLKESFDSKHLSDITKRRWLYLAHEFLDFIDKKNIKLKNIKSDHVLSYLASKRKTGVTGNAMRTTYYSLKSLFRLWGKKKVFEELEDFVPRGREPERPYFTVDETRMMLKAGREYYIDRGDFIGLRDLTMLMVSIDTGSRRIQLHRLNREHFTKEKTLKIPPSFKGGSWTERQLRKETIKFLNLYIAERKNRLGDDLQKKALFLDKSNKRISPEAMSYSFKKIREKAKIDKPRAGFHGFRRSKTTRLHEGGLSEIEIVKIMGWKEGSKEPHIYAQLDQNKVQKKGFDADSLMNEEEEE